MKATATICMLLCVAGAADLPPLPPSEPAAVVPAPTYSRVFVFDDDQPGVTNYVIEVNGWRTNSPAKSNRVELVQGTNLLTVASQRNGLTSTAASLTYVIAAAHIDIVRPKLTAALGEKWRTTNAWPALPYTNTPMGFFSYDVTPTNVLVEGPAR